MDRIAEITSEGFDAIAQLRELEDAALPPPEALHDHLRGLVEELLRRAAAAGLGREDAADVAYPVVALADEQILSRGSEELRAWWSARPLQLHFFQENVAGEAFFTRLDALRRDPRRLELLEAYLLALHFGFQGRYRVRGGELELAAIVEGVAAECARGRRLDPEALSPSGERPDAAALGTARPLLLLGVAGGAVLLALLVYVGLRVQLSASTGAVVDRIAALATP